jgi:hypothetical protein
VLIIPKRVSALFGCGILLGLGFFLFPSLAPLPGVFPLFIYLFIYYLAALMATSFRQNCGNLPEKKLSFGSVIKFGKKLQKNLQ